LDHIATAQNAGAAKNRAKIIAKTDFVKLKNLTKAKDRTKAKVIAKRGQHRGSTN